MAKRVQLTDQQTEDVVGGHFNWWREEDGTRKCWVNDIGVFVCSAEAKDTFAWLKTEHKGEWTEQQYVDALLASGDFTVA